VTSLPTGGHSLLGETTREQTQDHTDKHLSTPPECDAPRIWPNLAKAPRAELASRQFG
jgi:hypothetical protein